jgi:hypothetical protein
LAVNLSLLQKIRPLVDKPRSVFKTDKKEKKEKNSCPKRKKSTKLRPLKLK